MTDSKVYEAVGTLIKSSRLHKKLFDRYVEELGLNRTQHMMLMHLSKEGSLPSQKALADHLNITSAAVTRALKRLIDDGYICRKMGDDNRYFQLMLTPLGKSVVESSKNMIAELDKATFYGFSEDELIAYTNLGNKILSNLENKLKEYTEDNK